VILRTGHWLPRAVHVVFLAVELQESLSGHVHDQKLGDCSGVFLKSKFCLDLPNT